MSAVQAWKNPARAWGRYRAQYLWRCPSTRCRNTIVEPDWLPAATAIDWNLRGQRIGDRTKPLAPKTIARIEAGLAKFAGSLLVPVEGRDGKTAQPTRAPMRTRTARSETAVLVPYYGNGTPRATSAAHGTMTTRDRWAMVVPLRNHNTAKSVHEPLDTIAAAGNHHGLTIPAARVEDCEFRMLEPYEIKQAMAFDRDYLMLGTRREQVRLAGNAVTPPAARDLVGAVAEALGHHASTAA